MVYVQLQFALHESSYIIDLFLLVSLCFLFSLSLPWLIIVMGRLFLSQLYNTVLIVSVGCHCHQPPPRLWTVLVYVLLPASNTLFMNSSTSSSIFFSRSVFATCAASPSMQLPSSILSIATAARGTFLSPSMV